ncbi:uncharacterized protein LOC143444933 [Clavelina lepadiformis]|uniref:uncharacterized protein LOC143444933 n=1 Tax=Clavelina lepadiformis TaxID=159417 RepID=UPI004042E097
MDEFKGKVVLVTGASSGIGAEIARAFAKHQARLSITGRNEENLKKVAEECRKLGAKEVLEIIADLSKDNEAEKIVEETIKMFQNMDILINNAGTLSLSLISKATRKEFDETFDVNVKAVVFVTQQAIPYLEKTRGKCQKKLLKKLVIISTKKVGDKDGCLSGVSLQCWVNYIADVCTVCMHKATREEFDETFDVNVKAVVFLTQQAIPYLEKTKGNIVNISSIASHFYDPKVLLYSMSKAALDQFTRTVALEVAEKGIRVNSVNPGAVPTNILRLICDTSEEKEDFQKLSSTLHPLGKQNLTVEEIADSVLYLASERAKMVTGVCLDVDRGRSLTGQCYIHCWSPANVLSKYGSFRNVKSLWCKNAKIVLQLRSAAKTLSILKLKMTEFKGKVVLVTGASSGIGAEIARAFAKHQARLSITGRNEENLRKVAEECRKLGAEEVLEIIAELSEENEADKVVKETIEKFKNLDILVNNAGTAVRSTLATATRKEFDDIFDVNVKAVVFLTQQAIPYLEKTKGNIVNISSVSSCLYNQHILLYSMSKAALDQFTKTVALEMAEKGIRVNSVNPGYVPTNILRFISATSEKKKESDATKSKVYPLGKQNLTVEDIADAVLYLASERAKMITGVCLCVDRGRVLVGTKV